MPALKAKILNEEHPSYHATAMRRRRALYEGGETTRAMMKELLPKMPKEPKERYADRIKRSIYINYSGPICNFYAAYLFSQKPTIDVEGSAGAWYTGTDDDAEPGFLDNVDRKRSTWSSFWRDRLIDSAQNRVAYVWVNLPAAPEEPRPHLAEQEKSGDLNAYLVGLSAEEVIDWEDDESGQLERLLVKHVLEVRPSVAEGRKRLTRWTEITSELITVWEWMETDTQKDPKPEDMVDEKSSVKHGLGELPVVRVKLPHGFWLMEQLNDPAMACFFAENDLAWACYNTAHAIMWIRSVWETEPPTIGDGYFLQLHRDKQGDDEAGWLEIDGASHEVLRKRTIDLRQELYRVANQLALSSDQGASQAARSGDSKEMDYQSVAIVASEFAELLISAMRKTIQLVSAMRVDNASPKVGGLEGYNAVDVLAFLDAAAMAKPLVKSETFNREVAKKIVRHTIGDSLEAPVLAEIDDEIDAADYSSEAFAPFTPPPKADEKKNGDDTKGDGDGKGEDDD